MHSQVHLGGRSGSIGVSSSSWSVMARFDIESSYRIVPVHPEDRVLLGMDGTGSCTALPFGLCSAQKIFNSLADALSWRLTTQGMTILRYLDFFLVGKADSRECEHALSLSHYATLGAPIASHKTECLTARLVFLVIELDATMGHM